MQVMTMSMSNADLIVDVIAIAIGLIAIVGVTRLNRNLGGKMKSALQFFVLGILSNIVAMIWTSFYGHTYTIGMTTFDIHNFFMAVGMLFFILSTWRFSLLIPRS